MSAAPSDGGPDSAAGTPDNTNGGHQIGLIPCLAFSLGTIIGGGVFALSGIAVDKAGPGALAAFAIAGAVMMLSALSLMVIASRSKPGETGYAAIEAILGPRWRFLGRYT